MMGHKNLDVLITPIGVIYAWHHGVEFIQILLIAIITPRCQILHHILYSVMIVSYSYL